MSNVNKLYLQSCAFGYEAIIFMHLASALKSFVTKLLKKKKHSLNSTLMFNKTLQIFLNRFEQFQPVKYAGFPCAMDHHCTNN